MKRILIIDDDAEVGNLLRLALESAGYDVLTAGNGATGVNLARQSPAFDMVITDIFMPDKDGMEVIAELRCIQPTVKIIAMSGGAPRCDSHEFLNMAKLFGADRILEKPFAPSRLLGVIKEML